MCGFFSSSISLKTGMLQTIEWGVNVVKKGRVLIHRGAEGKENGDWGRGKGKHNVRLPYGGWGGRFLHGMA